MILKVSHNQITGIIYDFQFWKQVLLEVTIQYFRAIHQQRGFIRELFENGKNGSIYQKIYNNNQLDTYTIDNFESRIEKFINEDKVALIASDAMFKKYNKYECKVNANFIP